jgi:Family of unknown function (DUF5985)
MNGFKIGLLSAAVLTSCACTVLLFRAYRRRHIRLLMWSSICFAGLTLNNVALFVDLVIFPQIDLRLARVICALIGMLCLLYAFIWDVDEMRR